MTLIFPKWLGDQEVLNNKIKNGKAKQDDIMNQVDALHESLLDSPLSKDWAEVMQRVFHSPNYVNQLGVMHAEERGKTCEVLEICQRKWLLASCFHKDDTGQHHLYMHYYIICNCDKKVYLMHEAAERLPEEAFLLEGLQASSK